MTKLNTLCCALILFSIGPTTVHGDFTLLAPPSTFPDQATITISRHDVDKRAATRTLSTQANPDGSLHLFVEEEAGIYHLAANSLPEIVLAPAADETLTLSAHNSELTVAGSPGSEILHRYEILRKASLGRLVFPVRAEIKNAKIRLASDDEIARLTQAEVDAYLAHQNELNDFVIANAGSTMALYGTSLRWNADYRADELSNLVERFTSEHGKIAAAASLENRITTFRHTAIGALAPHISANTPKGQIDSLANYKGRYVLVDFWASWCPPCRVENQHYRHVITQANPNRFTIFAVNLDSQERAWTQAISRDQANWIHISDLQGWTSPLAAAYGVTALPTSFLLDPEGRIIAKNLRGPALDSKLLELGLLQN